MIGDGQLAAPASPWLFIPRAMLLQEGLHEKFWEKPGEETDPAHD